jgi:hypothetical protein
MNTVKKRIGHKIPQKKPAHVNPIIPWRTKQLRAGDGLGGRGCSMRGASGGHAPRVGHRGTRDAEPHRWHEVGSAREERERRGGGGGEPARVDAQRWRIAGELEEGESRTRSSSWCGTEQWQRKALYTRNKTVVHRTFLPQDKKAQTCGPRD